MFDVSYIGRKLIKFVSCRSLKSTTSGIKVTLISLPNQCHSICDALREAFNSKYLLGLRTDIIIVSNLIYNIE